MIYDVELRTFDTVDDYLSNTFVSSELKVKKVDLMKYAVLVGEFSNFSVTKEGKIFYESLVDMVFNHLNNKFVAGDSYKNAETTVKTSIGFLIGMISAKCVADKVFNIGYLHHLKDPRIKEYKSRLHPDFFGIDHDGNAYIVEAKATNAEKVDNSKVKKGKEQTQSIKKVSYERDNGVVQLYDEFKRHVVTAAFENNEYILSDIDPDEKNGEKEIYMNENLVFFNYYKNIYNYLVSKSNNSLGKEKIKIDQLEFVVLNSEVGKFGIEAKIFSILEDYHNVFSECNSPENKWLFDEEELLFLKDNSLSKMENSKSNKFKDNKISKEVDKQKIEKKLKSISGLSAKITKLENHSRFKKFIDGNEDISLGHDGIIYIYNTK
ncbi:hypothetical protein [Enterococcus sp. S52]|nr:hypothetical protein [Enterococcus sp. S52]